MKRQLIALGICATSLLLLATTVRPAYALRTITIFEQEGRAKSLGAVKNDSHYILKGAFGGRSNDSADQFVFDVRQAGTYTLVFNPSNISQTIRNAQLSIATHSTFSSGRGIASTGTNQPLSIFLPRGRYKILLSGQSSLSGGQVLQHQTHLITPR